MRACRSPTLTRSGPRARGSLLLLFGAINWVLVFNDLKGKRIILICLTQGRFLKDKWNICPWQEGVPENLVLPTCHPKCPLTRSPLCSDINLGCLEGRKESIFPFWPPASPVRQRERMQTHSLALHELLIIGVCRFGSVWLWLLLWTFREVRTLPPGFSTIICKCSFVLATDCEEWVGCGLVNIILKGCLEISSSQLYVPVMELWGEPWGCQC